MSILIKTKKRLFMYDAIAVIAGDRIAASIMTEGVLTSSSSDSSIEIVEADDCITAKTSTSSQPTMDKQKDEKLIWKRGEYRTDVAEDPPWYIAWMVQLAFSVMFFGSVFADWLRTKGLIRVKIAEDNDRHKDFARLDNHFEAIYINYIYRMSSDVVNRPLASVPASIMKLKDRYTDDYGWTQKFTGTESDVVNLGSYNYLGFSHNDGACAEEASKYIDQYGLHCGGTKNERGNHVTHRKLEQCVAHYLGVEDAICFPMGFGTNSMNIPSLVGKNSLILSDELNHASLVLGCRMSGAAIKVFKHNNAADCEKKLRDALCRPSPKTGEKYDKVLIVIEGIYSMEGSIVNLPEFIKLKKKYGTYLFLDEAHSVGALGPTGKGVAEYWGCNPRDVDIMMGTLTKSFAAAGGYMGGAKSTIDHIRVCSAGPCYGTSMSPPIIAQVLSSMKVMLGEDGTDIGARKATQLLRNSRYFRARLKQMGFMVFGHEDSPVVPLMTFYLTKVVDFSRRTLKSNVGLVAVGYPATPVTKARVRFCLSADHTQEQLDYVLKVVDQVGDETNTKYGKKPKHIVPIEY